jgi:hypothetical protein
MQSPVKKVYGVSDRLYQPTAYMHSVTQKDVVALARAAKREAREAEYTFQPKLVSKQSVKPKKKLVSDDSWRRISSAISTDLMSKEVAECMKCDIAFSLIIRRQMCKTCDLVLCSDCNPSLMVQLGTTVTRVRQCITCRASNPLPVPAYNGAPNKKFTKPDTINETQDTENQCPNLTNTTLLSVTNPLKSFLTPAAVPVPVPVLTACTEETPLMQSAADTMYTHVQEVTGDSDAQVKARETVVMPAEAIAADAVAAEPVATEDDIEIEAEMEVEVEIKCAGSLEQEEEVVAEAVEKASETVAEAVEEGVVEAEAENEIQASDSIDLRDINPLVLSVDYGEELGMSSSSSSFNSCFQSVDSMERGASCD